MDVEAQHTRRRRWGRDSVWGEGHGGNFLQEERETKATYLAVVVVVIVYYSIASPCGPTTFTLHYSSGMYA